MKVTKRLTVPGSNPGYATAVVIEGIRSFPGSFHL